MEVLTSVYNVCGTALVYLQLVLMDYIKAGLYKARGTALIMVETNLIPHEWKGQNKDEKLVQGRCQLVAEAQEESRCPDALSGAYPLGYDMGVVQIMGCKKDDTLSGLQDSSFLALNE